MRFLLDVCASSQRMQSALLDQGHDVLSALDWNPSAADEELLATVVEKVIAMQELIAHHPDAMSEPALIVVTGSRVRLRRRESEEGRGA